MLNKAFERLKRAIENGEEISPFLFLGRQNELLNAKVREKAQELLKSFDIPLSYLFILGDNHEPIKIKELKEFIHFSHSQPPYPFQIFLFENIARLTLTSSNSLLKFFEEPGKKNIILLTAQGENEILETILSRVQSVRLEETSENNASKYAFYVDMIENVCIKKASAGEMLGYFFNHKGEEQEYREFLEALILCSKKHGILHDCLDEINEDMSAIVKNNVNGKYVVDKYLLKICEIYG